MTIPPTLSETGAALCLVFIAIAPCAAAGLTLMNAGLGRSRNAAHSLLVALCVMAVAAVAYYSLGFGFQGYPGHGARTFMVGGRVWDWIASEPFFFRGLALDLSPGSLAALFGMMAAGIAALIPLGSGAGRWRLGAACISGALLAGWVYPLFAHWVWGGGWLAQLGRNYGLGRGFVDAGGSAPIQAVGGLTGLAVAWILGPRRGKYTLQRMPVAIPGHNAVYVLFGCWLSWIGWLALDSSGAILFAGVEPPRVVVIAVNATLSAAAAVLAAAGITRFRFAKPDASLCANAWIGGLAASSGVCAFTRPASAILIGLVAGALVVYSVEWLEFHLTVDDPGGAVSAHAVAGIWGVLAVGLFARFPDGPAEGQWLAQLAGIATLVGFVLPLTYGLNWLLHRIYPQRVSPQGERDGLDLHELGGGAYPEFMSHNEE